VRGISRILAAVAAVAAAGLLVVGLSPTAEAAKPRPTVVEVSGSNTYEYQKTCADWGTYACGTYSTSALFYFRIPLPPRQPLTLGYVIEDISATNGLDYQGATSGTITIPTDRNFAYILLPVVNDGLAEGSETLRLRLTSSSDPAVDISQTGLTTILDGGAIPADCNLYRADYATVSLTCDSRPTGQSWHLMVTCGDGFTTRSAVGNSVTGSGRSTAVCTNPEHSDRYQFVIE
jgi:hypothetical protein